MASGSLPPGFPATEVDGEYYWDGGLVSTLHCNGCSTANRGRTRSRSKSIFGAPTGRCHVI
jgi:hypothetical protein